MKNEQKIEELQIVIGRLLCGLNADSLNLEWYYFFEDAIANKDFTFTCDLLKEKDHSGMSEINRLALLFIFENASRSYRDIIGSSKYDKSKITT